jgi:hypothetical protein
MSRFYKGKLLDQYEIRDTLFHRSSNELDTIIWWLNELNEHNQCLLQKIEELEKKDERNKILIDKYDDYFTTVELAVNSFNNITKGLKK